jgi:copper chaperone CopZ
MIDLTQNILDIEGKNSTCKYEKSTIEEVVKIVDGVEVKEEKEVRKLFNREFTLGLALRDTVLGEIDDVKKVSEEEHLLRYSLFERTRGEQAEFSDEEISFMKGLICKRYLPITAAQVLLMLSV